jgi:hypothetical protein
MKRTLLLVLLVASIASARIKTDDYPTDCYVTQSFVIQGGCFMWIKADGRLYEVKNIGFLVCHSLQSGRSYSGKLKTNILGGLISLVWTDVKGKQHVSENQIVSTSL